MRHHDVAHRAKPVQLGSLARRKVHTPMRPRAVPISRSAERVLPAGIMQADQIPDEWHPVGDGRLVLRSVIVGALERRSARIRVDDVHARGSKTSRTAARLAAHDVRFPDNLAVLIEEARMLRRQVNIDVASAPIATADPVPRVRGLAARQASLARLVSLDRRLRPIEERVAVDLPAI